MDVRLDDDVDTTDTIKLYLHIFVVSPVSLADKIRATGVVFGVPFRQDRVWVKFLAQSSALVRFDPGIVVN